MNNTLIGKLEFKFPKRLIRQRAIGSGDRQVIIDYVTGSHIIRRLNECFSQEWSFEVKKDIVDFEHGQILVLGRLKVPYFQYDLLKGEEKKSIITKEKGQITVNEKKFSEHEDCEHYWIEKEQWGGTSITRYAKSRQLVDLGNDMKAATTDALKKCATLFGIALHLYDGDESISTTLDEAPSNENEATPEPKEKVQKPITLQQTNALKKILAKDNITEENLLAQCQKQNLKEFTYDEASELITKTHKFWKTIVS